MGHRPPPLETSGDVQAQRRERAHEREHDAVDEDHDGSAPPGQELGGAAPEVRPRGILERRGGLPWKVLADRLSTPGGPAKDSKPTEHDWPVYGADPEGNRYSSLTQINRDNVKSLKMVLRAATPGEKGGLEDRAPS